MTDVSTLYREVKGDLQQVADPLFDFVCQQVEKRGAFLSVGSTLSTSGQVQLIVAASEEEVITNEAMLPLLIEALTDAAKTGDAVALCEWVKIEQGKGKRTDAVKVVAQHKRGLTVAFYLPAKKGLFRGWQFGEMVVTDADPLVETWP